MAIRHLARLLLASTFTAALTMACDSPPAVALRPAHPMSDAIAVAPGDDLPPSSPSYSTEPTGGAVVGGPLAGAAERQVLDALGKRGDHPVGDGRLALLARWAVRRAARGMTLDPALVDAVARRVGYVGPMPWVTFFQRTGGGVHPIGEADLQKAIDAIPTNVPMTRYGIATFARGGGGDVIAVALNALELTLQPVQKRFAVNDKLHLASTLGDRFEGGHLAVTLPGGQVRTWDSASRDLAGDWVFTLSGVHQIELLGDGPSGPVVVANFPVYVGVDEPQPEPGDGAPTAPGNASQAADASSVEASMLALLNQVRAEAHLKPVEKDDALAAVARAHSEDMAEHSFFGHVSPTAGTTEDRLRAAHQLHSLVGENVARSDSAQHAHDSLMASPAHRDVMLRADFTHVGIGAVVRPSAGKVAGVYVTMEFAREQSIALEDVPRLVLEATDMARVPHFVARLKLDDSLTSAAREAVAILASDSSATQRALDTAKAAAVRGRTHPPGTCVILLKSVDATRMDAPLATQDVRAERMGVAAMRDPDGPETFHVVLVVQAGPKRGLTCE